MDKISKSLLKFTVSEKKAVKNILELVKSGQFKGLDIVKLKNRAFIYRIRKGRIRIVLKMDGSKISILTIERRSEKTYKNL